MGKKPKPKPPIPAAFKAKKEAILTSLAIPSDSYTDASPKGSVDEAIRGLIDRLNKLEGVVTTSSCAGRVSVFAEGNKQAHRAASSSDDRLDGQNRNGEGDDHEHDDVVEPTARTSVPGGKGNGGRWLFVSHEPLDKALDGGELSSLLGLPTPADTSNKPVTVKDTKSMRLVRFQFEPMILHIMTASLHHAQPILAAAINAGFRESGVQSLKNLDDENAFPMVAVRSSGLAFESLVGYVSTSEECEERVVGFVDGRQLEILVGISRERFLTNSERIRRFEEEVFAKQASRRQETRRRNRFHTECSGFATESRSSEPKTLNVDDIADAGLFD